MIVWICCLELDSHQNPAIFTFAERNLYYPVGICAAQLCVWSCRCVCTYVQVCNQKHLFRILPVCQSLSAACSQDLYVAKNANWTFSESWMLDICHMAWSPMMPKDYYGAHLLTAQIIEVVTPTTDWHDWKCREKPTPTWWQCINLNSVQHSPLTVFSTHRVCVLWNSSIQCSQYVRLVFIRACDVMSCFC